MMRSMQGEGIERLRIEIRESSKNIESIPNSTPTLSVNNVNLVMSVWVSGMIHRVLGTKYTDLRQPTKRSAGAD